MPDPGSLQHKSPLKFTIPFATALRDCWREGYSLRLLKADLLAGMTVGIIAIPLAMALALASGVAPQHGLYTAVVAGAIAALLGGSRVSVTGPTAAFVVILTPVSAKYGLGGLMIATVMAGTILLLMGLARMGRLIHFIPHPVTTGFTAGIAVVIASLQLKDFLGLTLAFPAEHFIERVGALVAAIPSVQWEEALVGGVTLVTLVLWPRITRKIPAALVGAFVGAVVAMLLERLVEGFSVETIASSFSTIVEGREHRGIPPLPPSIHLPWEMPGGDGAPVGISLGLLRDLMGSATAIALLGAIESLLCAVVADGMADTKHDPDAELVAQGVANIVTPFLGGFAATGAIARSAANINSGARTPLAAFFHAMVVLASLLLLAPVLGHLPLATLAALLLVVAWNMSDTRHFLHILKVAPRSDILVLLTCFSLTVVFDMAVAVGVGVVLAALLFMKRMAEICSVSMAEESHPIHERKLPEGVQFYRIAGPLFFGAAERALSTMRQFTTGAKARVIIIDMSQVPAMDMTGLVALETIINKLRTNNVFTILCEVKVQPRRTLEKAGLRSDPERLAFCSSWEDAADLAELRTHFG